MQQSELKAAVKRDVDVYIRTLRGVDPGASDESYSRLHKHLCSVVYEMRSPKTGEATTQ